MGLKSILFLATLFCVDAAIPDVNSLRYNPFVDRTPKPLEQIDYVLFDGLQKWLISNSAPRTLEPQNPNSQTQISNTLRENHLLRKGIEKQIDKRPYSWHWWQLEVMMQTPQKLPKNNHQLVAASIKVSPERGKLVCFLLLVINEFTVSSQ